MNYRRTRISDGRSVVSNDCRRPSDFHHRNPQIEPQFRFNPLLHYQTFPRSYTLNDSLPSTTNFMNPSVRLLEWMPRIAPVSTHIPPISLVYSSPVIVDVPSDSMPLDLTTSRHSFYAPQHARCEAAIDMSIMASRGRSYSMQRGGNLSSAQRPLPSDEMLEMLPSGGAEEFAPSGKGRKSSRGSKCGGNTRTGRKRGGKNQQKTQKQQTATLTPLAGSCLSPTRTMEAVEGLLMLPESSSPSSTAVSGAGEVSTSKRLKTPRKSRKPMNYRPIDYLTQSRNSEEPSSAALQSEFPVNRIYGRAAAELEGRTASSGTAIALESPLSQFCRLLESSCCPTLTGSVSMQNSQPVASCITVTATETQTSPARSNVCPPVPLRAPGLPQSLESKATETLVSTADNGCQTDDDFGATCRDHILNPLLSNTWTTKEMEVDCASGVHSPLPADVSFNGEVESLLSLDLPQMKDLIHRLQRRVEMLEQTMGSRSSAEHLLPFDSFGSEPLFDSTAVVQSREIERSPHEMSESEESLHLRLSESDDFVDLEQQLPDSCHHSPDGGHLPSNIDSAPVDTEPGEKSCDFALSDKISYLKHQLKAIENQFVSVETFDEERNSDDAFQGDLDSVGHETDGSMSVTSCRASEIQNADTMSSASSRSAEDIICVHEKSDAGTIRPLEVNDYYELQTSAAVTQQNSELSTVLDQMASLDIAMGYVLNNYQSKLQLEAISPPSSVISLHDDETGQMDLNLEDDIVIIAHESESNKVLEGISDVTDCHSGQSNCREIVGISASTPSAEDSFSDCILSRVTCVSDNINTGKIVSAESNTGDNLSDGTDVGSSLREDVADTSTDTVICDVSDMNDIAPDRVLQTDTGILDTVKEINRSHEVQVGVDDVDDAQDERTNDGTEQSDSLERDEPKDEVLSLHVNTASLENEVASRCVQSVALLSEDGLESDVDATETPQAAGDTCRTHDANDCLTVETFSEEVVIDINKPQLPSEGLHGENVVSDLSSGAYGTLLDARVVIKRLNLDAFLEMKTKVRDYKPVVAQWLHRPRRPRRRCRKTKSKGKHMQIPLHYDHNYVQPTLDKCSRIVDSSEAPKHILQNVEVVAVQQSNDLSTSIEPYDVRPHDVELVTTFPLSFDSDLSGMHIDCSGTVVSSSSDVDQSPRLHQDNSTVQENAAAADEDTEGEINFTSNNEVISEEDSEFECTDSFSGRCSESSVAMTVINSVAMSVDDGCQAPQHEPGVIVDCTGATFGNCDKSVLDILATDAPTVENSDLIGSAGVFVCSDQARTSAVPKVLDRGINKVVKKLRMISQEVKKLSGGPQEMETHFPSYPEDKKKASKARLRGLPVQSLALGSSDCIALHRGTEGERGTAEDLLNVAGPDLSNEKEIALEHEVRKDAPAGVMHLPGSGHGGCQGRTEEMHNTGSDMDNSEEQQTPLAVVNADSAWLNEETVEADTAGGNPVAAGDSNASDHMDMNVSGHLNDSINVGIVASQNVLRKRGRNLKVRSWPCSVANDGCKDTALPHGTGKVFDEHEDRGGVIASKSTQRKCRGRPRSMHFLSSSDDETSTRAEKSTKYDTSQTIETAKTNQGHRTSKQSRNLFSEINSSNIVSEEQSSSVSFDFSLRNSEAAHDGASTRRIGCRMGRPPKHHLHPKNPSDQGSEFRSQSEKQIRNKKKSGRLGDHNTNQQQYSPRERSINGPRKTSEIDCRKYKTKNVQGGQYASDRKPLALNTAGDEDRKYTRKEIPLVKTMNLTSEVVIRKMHVNICRGKLAMVVDVISRTVSSGSRLAQCLFCEFLAPNIKDIGQHLDECHSEFVLVISKVRASQESSVRFFCRHCQFVTVDHTVMWIHFEISHNIRGILTSESHVNSDLGGHEPEFQPLSLDQLVHFDRVYMCPECGNLTENRKAMTSHVVRSHTTENYCNGNFIKSIALTRPRNPSKQPTYHSLVMDDAFSVYRKPCYICVFCQFVVFEARLALSHFICFHVKKKLLMVCMKDSCGQRFVKERRFYEHMKQIHNGRDLGAYFDCSVTLLEDSSLSGEIAEVLFPAVHNGSRQPASPSHS